MERRGNNYCYLGVYNSLYKIYYIVKGVIYEAGVQCEYAQYTLARDVA